MQPVSQHTQPLNNNFSLAEKIQIDDAISDLLSIGAIAECTPCPGQFLSSIFLVPKPNGKMRFILNLKNLNKFVETSHFKLEDLRTALKLISKDVCLAKIDVKDAYFFISIHPNYRKYLRFHWQHNNYNSGTLYEFNVLPFVLSTAPYVFTKVMKPVTRLLRSAGYLSTVYLDDWFLIGIL